MERSYTDALRQEDAVEREEQAVHNGCTARHAVRGGMLGDKIGRDKENGSSRNEDAEMDNRENEIGQNTEYYHQIKNENGTDRGEDKDTTFTMVRPLGEKGRNTHWKNCGENED